MNVVTYYNIFKGLWDELYGDEDLTCGCTCVVAAKLKAQIERDNTHDFLLGLDDEQFGDLRTQILGLDPFPTLNRAFAMVSQEEHHQSIVHF